MTTASVPAAAFDPVAEHFNRNLLFATGAFLTSAIAVFYFHIQGPSFQAVIDTSMTLTDALLALLLWDVGANTGETLPLLLSVTFSIVALAEFLRMWTMFDMLDGRRDFDLNDLQWRVGEWGPVAFLQVLGVSAAFLARKKERSWGWLFALSLLLANIVLAELFKALPSLENPLFGLHHPVLLAVSLLWVAIALAFWSIRDQSDIARALAITAAFLAAAHLPTPFVEDDLGSLALFAHAACLIGHVMFLLSLMQIGAADTARRKVAETGLTRLNRELEERVRDRTALLEDANNELQAAAIQREKAGLKLRAQFERLKLLDEITRAITARQDSQSIFQVIVGSLETQLPADFVCICQYDAGRHILTVANVSARGDNLARALNMRAGSHIEIDANGLSRAVKGHLVYEPDAAAVDFPFPQRLAKQNLRAVVISPLLVDEGTFGLIITARYAANTFDSTDCEFLKQLSEHAAIAARQARLHTSLQVAYNDLRQTQQAVMQQERLRALGQMASGIAHDINNAISPVSIYTETLLETENPSQGQVRSYLDIVKQVIDDVAATVGRLREFYREHEPRAATAAVDLNKLAQDVAELTRARWSNIPQQRGLTITLRCDLDPSLPAVQAVEHEIREALTNLVFNAVDALPQGGAIVLRTGVRAPTSAENGPQVRLEVVDNGVGMDDATRQRCMEPFFTTKGERGTGLGLAMVYGIANRQKANLEIDSIPGRGTTVRLTFAASTGAVMPAGAPRAVKPARAMNLLIIDDDPAVLESTSVALERDGHSVTKANGGHEGIEAFKSAAASGKPFDAVFTDLGMPNIDGSQVARAIKAASATTPVVLLTGWGRRMTADDDMTSNIDFSLGKPPSLKDIREVLVRISGLP